MARIRTIKPGFFRHEALFDAERGTGLPLRLAFAGLWTAADREGRFKWRPRELKLDCLPHDDVDFAMVLDGLAAIGLIQKYEVDGECFGFIPNWKKHQVINQREAQSCLPEPSTDLHVPAHAEPVQASAHIPSGVNIPEPLRMTIVARDKKCLRCEAVDDLTVDHIFPRSIGGTHAIKNLRTLCRRCNSARPVAGQGLIDDLAKDGLTLADMQRMCTHVHAQGEGKGREGERKEDSEAIASGADAPLDPAVPEREYFMRGREVLGSKSGAMIANLLKAKGRNVALARAALEQASTKQNPMEFVAAICRGPPQARASTVHQQRQAEGRAILDELHEFNTSPSSRAHPGLLRHDPGDGAEGICGGAGGNLIELSPVRD